MMPDPLDPRRSAWRLNLLGLGLFVFALAALSGPGRIDIEDGQDRFEAGLNLLEHGEPSIRDPRAVWHRFPGRGGHDFTYYRFPGEFVAAASIVVADLWSTDEAWRHFVFSFNGAVTAALLAVLFATWFRKQGSQHPLLWALAGIVCTPCWYYSATTFDDLLGTLFVVLAIVAADRSKQNPWWLLVSSLAIAMSLNCKQPLAAVLLPALAFADRPGSYRILRAGVLCCGFVAGYAAYVGYETWKFPPAEKAKHAEIMAEWGLTIFSGQPLQAVLDYIAGPSSGTLWYAPAILLGVVGAMTLRPRLVISVALAIVAIAGFFALLTFYKGGVCWGPRYLTPLFGLLWLFAPLGACQLGPPTTALLLTLGFAVQVLGLALVPERLYVEQKVPSGFYTVDPWLYLEPAIGHIVNRPREIVDAATAPPSPEFTPGPTPTYTMPVFDPPFYDGPKGIAGVRRYTLLNDFRPWWVTLPQADPPPIAYGKPLAFFLCAAVAGLFLLRWKGE